MKNLKILDIKLVCNNMELFYYMEALKGFENLEEFNIDYYEEKFERYEIDCRIPLECLKNLKKMNLTLNRRFSEASVNNFIEGVHKLENLKFLLVSPSVLMEIGSKNTEKLIENLRGMKHLERADFVWNDEEILKKVRVEIWKDVNSGEMKVTSTPEEEKEVKGEFTKILLRFCE